MPPNRHQLRLLLPLVLVGLSLTCGGAEPPEGVAHRFEAQELATGIRLFHPSSESTEHTNSLVIERAGDLVVVEAQPTPAAARDLLAAIEAVTPKPVRFLVLSHAHSEASGGATAFPESALVIASSDCTALLAEPDLDLGNEMRQRSGAPEGWSPPPRRIPDVSLVGPMRIEDPDVPVLLQPGGHTHSQGDLTVQLPRQDILYLGSILAPDRNPYGGDADVRNWISALNHMARRGAKWLVPLRGAPVEVADLRVQRSALAWLVGHVQYSLSRRTPREQIVSAMLEHEELALHFDVDAEPSFLRILIERTIDELLAEQKSLGQP